MKTKLFNNVILLLLATLFFASCGTKRTVPITGRSYRIGEGWFSDAQMLQNSKSFYGKYITQCGGDSRDRVKTDMVKRVANNLITVTNNYLKSNGYADELKFFEWDVHLVPAPGEVNATCMAGGKILVYEGILPIAKNDAGLAAILGHEIGHAIGHHMAEQLTKLKKKEIGQTLGSAGFGIWGTLQGGSSEEVGDIIEQSVDLSNDIMQYFEMSYSRKHELEADHIGMILMAIAGYDPHEAPKVWERMTEAFGDNPNRLLSTHPSNAKRQKCMEQKWMNEAMSYYNNSGKINTKEVDKPNTAGSTTEKGKQSGEMNYIVQASKLNVRSAPSTSDSQIVGSLSKGQTVKVYSINDGWANINYNGKTYYVKADYLRPSK